MKCILNEYLCVTVVVDVNVVYVKIVIVSHSLFTKLNIKIGLN